MELNFGRVVGLPQDEQEMLNDLLKIYNNHKSANRKKRRYYDGKITLGEVNLGIALPHALQKLEIGCAWGEKTVDVLAARSMFDGFVMENGNAADSMKQIMKRNHLISEYNKSCKEELKYGSVYAAVSGEKGNAKINFYSPSCAAARWDEHNKRIDCGFAFEDGKLGENSIEWSPQYVTFYTDRDIWELERKAGVWFAKRFPHKFGKPLLVPFVWNATCEKPLGQSRLKEPIRRLIQGFVRTVANASIGLEFATSPQKYLLGITDEQYDALIDQKFAQYVGTILMGTTNPETGEKPTFGQLQQGTIEPHIQMMRMLATQFSAASGLTVTDTGVVNDANPTSYEAILAQSQTLVGLAEQLNAGNSDSFYELSQMALAIELGTVPEELGEEEKGIIAHFKNPAMPSVAATADAAIKIASAREGFAGTDVFLEMIGFAQADIRRIKAQEQRNRGEKILREEFDNADNDTGMAGIYPEDGPDQ